jgi:DNA-binding MarR family transcriptional regulator
MNNLAMPKDPLNEREFELINIIGAKLGSNQRDLSRQLNLSLGQTNMLVRRLAAKGYIRINQLNKRKVKYLLTPKGFTEKMHKSIKYTLNTINSIGLINNKIRALLKQLHDSGERKFYILGASDLVTMVETAFRETPLNTCEILRGVEWPADKPNYVVLICTEEFNKGNLKDNKCANLIEVLAQDHEFVQMGNGAQNHLGTERA